MYTEEEMKKAKTKLTPMVVRMPDAERKRIQADQRSSRTSGLAKFVDQIK